jgi:hypothetical protein
MQPKSYTTFIQLVVTKEKIGANEQSYTYTVHQCFYVETQSGRKPHNVFLICLEELHSLEAPTSFVFQLQLEGGSNPLVSQATT